MKLHGRCAAIRVLLVGALLIGSPAPRSAPPAEANPSVRPTGLRTWLPDLDTPVGGGGEGRAAAETLLARVRGSLRCAVSSYSGPRLAECRPLQGQELATPSGRWRCTVDARPAADDVDAVNLEVAFRLVEGSAEETGVAVAFDFTGWNTHRYVLIPAVAYNGNRNRVVKREYAAGLDRSDLNRKDLPLTTGELPQLSPEPGAPSRIEVSTCNATTPAMAFLDRDAHRAFLVLAEQATRFGDNGLTIEESADRSRASFVVTAPCVRERKPEFIGFSPSPDRGARWKAGDEVKLRMRILAFEASDIPALLDRFFTVRKAVTGPNQPRNLIPFGEVTRLMTRRIDSRFHEGKEFQFYCPENAAWISFGWVGGLMDTFPMLALGDAARLERVGRTFNFAIPRAQGAAGYFYGALDHDGRCFGREGYDERPEIVLTRKNGDVLFWMIKQFLLLESQGRTNAIDPVWQRGTLRLARAFADTWRRCGQWGNFVDNRTGEVVVYGSTSGASAIGGMALASHYFREPEFLEIAKEAAGFYYRREVLALGLTTGACADILQNADSESAAGFMTSLMVLYEVTGDAKWLAMCRTLAHLTATWVVSYDYRLPPETELAKLGARLTGVVWASTQNKHGAPGSCTSSCDPFFKLYRATGDRRYAELLRDIVHAHAEGIKPTGEITERLTYCDADSRGSRGDGSTGWCELNGILMAMELPGVHVRLDTGELVVFDHVEARLLPSEGKTRWLEIRNPTRFDTSVTVLVEDARQAAQPLGYTAFTRWPKIEVRAGAVAQFALPAAP